MSGLPRKALPGLALRVDHERRGQALADLRRLALIAPHARSRKRLLALLGITQGACATLVAARTGRLCCRETVRAVLHRLGLPWKPARSRASVRACCPAVPIPGDGTLSSDSAAPCWTAPGMAGASWLVGTKRTFTGMSTSATTGATAGAGAASGSLLCPVRPGFQPRPCSPANPLGLTCGPCFCSKGQARLQPYARADGKPTMDVPRRLRAEIPGRNSDGKLVVARDGAPHRRRRRGPKPQASASACGAARLQSWPDAGGNAAALG